MITKEIIRMLNESKENIAEIQRNEFAGIMGCVPSQINYVLSSRFTPEHGYIIESRRGGGGYIRIKRITINSSSALMHIINSIGQEIDLITTRIVLENCIETGLISKEVAYVMAAAVSENAMQQVTSGLKNKLRASILKQMLLTQI